MENDFEDMQFQGSMKVVLGYLVQALDSNNKILLKKILWEFRGISEAVDQARSVISASETKDAISAVLKARIANIPIELKHHDS